jgi:hypothetical protein
MVGITLKGVGRHVSSVSKRTTLQFITQRSKIVIHVPAITALATLSP